MIIFNRFRYTFRIAYLIFAILFSVNQLVWGATFVSTCEPTAQPGATQEELTNNENTAKTLINTKNIIELFFVSSSSGPTETYYTSGMLESITFITPDEDGNIYYHYLDEDWNSTGQGRVDSSYRQTADPEGGLAYTYTYHGSTTSWINTKCIYSDTDLKTLIRTDYYFNDANNRVYYSRTSAGAWTYYFNDANHRIRSKAMTPDADGFVYYEYLNEDWSSLGIGRITRSKKQVVGADGGLSYEFSYSGSCLLTKKIFSDRNFTNLIKKYTYFAGSDERRETYIDYITGVTTNYYNNEDNRIAYTETSAPDANGLVYCHYIDEDWNSTGQGRVDRAYRQIADSDGGLAYTYTYYDSITNSMIKIRNVYSDINFKTLIRTYRYFNDTDNRINYCVDSINKIWTTYYNDSNNRIFTTAMAAPDADGFTYHEYLNEDWDGRGIGRVFKARRSSAGSDGGLSYEFEYSGNYLLTKSVYSDKNFTTLIMQYTYYNNSDNRLASVETSTPDSNGFIYYSYIDEDWNGTGCGRIAKAKRSSADSNGGIGYVYSYYGAASRIFTTNVYSDNNFTIRIQAILYFNDVNNRMQTYRNLKTGVTLNYFNDTNHRISSMDMTTQDKDGFIHYLYLNEDWNGQGYGRIELASRHTWLNGELVFTYKYYEDSTGRLYSKSSYSDTGCKTQVRSYTYYNDLYNRLQTMTDNYGVVTTYYNDPSSRIKSKTGAAETITYYNDNNNLIESVTLNTEDDEGMIYYHYLNEDWAGEGHGRADRAKRNSSLNYELTYSYTYYSDTGRLRSTNAYIGEWSSLLSSFTYYDDEDNRLETKIAYWGSELSYFDTYHYINEDWDGQEHGRVDWYKSRGLGGYAYFYSYYDNEDGRLRERTCVAYNGWPNPNETLLYATVYYDDSSSYTMSKTFSIPNSVGFITYYYLNENWSDQGIGRIDKVVRSAPDADGLMVISKEYFSGTSQVRFERGYSDLDCTKLVLIREYDKDGQLIQTTYPPNDIVHV